MTEISVRMQVVIEKLNEENDALQVALDNANDTIARLEKALDEHKMGRSIFGVNADRDLQDEHNVEPETGDIVNWQWLGSEPIRYPVKAERLTLADYTEECNQ